MSRGIVRLRILQLSIALFFCIPQICVADPVYLVSPYQSKERALHVFNQYFSASTDSVILTDNSQSPDLGAMDVVKELREARQRITLVCFDRAAADCLSALLTYPHLQRNVGSFVSLQGKVLGLESSEGLIDPSGASLKKAAKMPLSGALRLIASFMWEYLFPKSKGAYSMRPSVRLSYIKRMKPQIKKMSQQFRILSIDTSDSKYGVIPFSHKILLSQVEKNKTQ